MNVGWYFGRFDRDFPLFFGMCASCTGELSPYRASGVHLGLTSIVRPVYKPDMAHLSKFMNDNDLSDEDVAAKIGVSRETINRIRRKTVRPNWLTIQKLKALSGGLITADDFEAKPLKPKGRARPVKSKMLSTR